MNLVVNDDWSVVTVFSFLEFWNGTDFQIMPKERRNLISVSLGSRGKRVI